MNEVYGVDLNEKTNEWKETEEKKNKRAEYKEEKR